MAEHYGFWSFRCILSFMPIRILCLGDVVGRPGRQILHQKLPALVRERAVDLVVANAENIAGGSGITANLFNKIRSYGVDVVTLGDHIYRKADIVPTLQAASESSARRTCPGRRRAGRIRSSPPTAAWQWGCFACWGEST